MPNQRKKARPGRTFIIALLAISLLVLFAFMRDYTKSSSNTLVKLSSDISSADQTPECHSVHDFKDQCAFVHKYCQAEEDQGLIPYLDLYFCKMSSVKPIAIILIAMWSAFLFSFIGIAASDFFCINLSTISNKLGMSESMAGVTFLAFGNGSPDVFSTFAAMKGGSGSLAVGELIGAASFITAVVSGSMAIIRPFKVAKKSFIRDVGFFIVAVAFTMVFLANGYLSLSESVVMVAFYIFYVSFVCVWHWWLARKQRLRQREMAIRSHYNIPGEDFDGEAAYRDEPDEETGSRRSYPIPVSNEDLNQLERVGWEESPTFDEVFDETVRDKWMGEMSSNMRVTKPPDGERPVAFPPIRPSLVGALEFRAVLASLQKSRNIQNLPISMRRYSDVSAAHSAPEQYDINSVISAPDPSNQLLDPNTYDRNARPATRLGLDAGQHGRHRSVSVNDAAASNIDHDALRNERRQPMDLLTSSPPKSDQQLSPSYGTFEPTDSGQEIQSKSPLKPPFLSVSQPSSEAVPTAEQAPLRTTRSRTMDYLAPPEPDLPPSRPRAQSATASPDPQGKSQRQYPLIPSLPGSTRHSPSHSPYHSPYIGPLIASPSSITSFHLPPPDSSSDGLFLNDEPPRPIAWWPYKILPSPQIFARTLFPTLCGWREKTFWERVLGVASAPCFFVLTLTLPVVEPSKAEPEPVEEPPGVITRDFASKSPRISLEQPSFGPEQPHSSAAVATINVEGQGPVDPEVVVTAPTDLDDDTLTHASTSKEWNRWLVLIQCFTSPYIILLTFWINASGDPDKLVMPTLWCLLGSGLALILVVLTTRSTRPPKWHFMLCFVGFAVAITWISRIAEEVVGVLKAIGVIFDISDAILGLTIFAVGNSMGDLVADITVARLGFPVMALSACFGGPLLNILLGIGLSGMYVTISRAQDHKEDHPRDPMKFQPYRIDVSSTLLISAVALLTTLLGLLILVPLNKWRMDKRIGYGLVSLWVVATVGNVVVELTGLAGHVA